MSRQGFTLIELAAILAILLILAIALVPRITANRASPYYAEAQTLGVAVAQSVSNYLVQDPERTPADLAGQLGLAP
ncbi:MAG: prepilin-type N-terminal cleavage/methylation domain-containing protein, partial [Meiothermus sp.]|nr:prepilin-type N-terminal cleavage/methylation domain-containing protein [Meiothermus sp.]